MTTGVTNITSNNMRILIAWKWWNQKACIL